ncbi:MAG: hypothetical protein ACC619_07795, partial [Paracoccaceae bacterium]
MKWLIATFLVVALFALWVRLAPSSPERWFVDPRTAPPAGSAGYLGVQDFAAPAKDVLAQLNAIV